MAARRWLAVGTSGGRRGVQGRVGAHLRRSERLALSRRSVTRDGEIVRHVSRAALTRRPCHTGLRRAARGAPARGAEAPHSGTQNEAIIARADTLLIAGRIFAAESLYYIAVRRGPRDPVARLALGRYLAQRGALKVGAVLMEEARYFGGDPDTRRARARAGVPALGEYNHLAALPASAVPYGRADARGISARQPPAIAGPDSAAVDYMVNDSQLLGRVKLLIGADTVMATIDARAEGLVLDTSWAKRKELRRFGSRNANVRDVDGVTPSVVLGPYTFTNVPTHFAPLHGCSTGDDRARSHRPARAELRSARGQGDAARERTPADELSGAAHRDDHQRPRRVRGEGRNDLPARPPRCAALLQELAMDAESEARRGAGGQRGAAEVVVKGVR